MFALVKQAWEKEKLLSLTASTQARGSSYYSNNNLLNLLQQTHRTKKMIISRGLTNTEQIKS